MSPLFMAVAMAGARRRLERQRRARERVRREHTTASADLLLWPRFAPTLQSSRPAASWIDNAIPPAGDSRYRPVHTVMWGAFEDDEPQSEPVERCTTQFDEEASTLDADELRRLNALLPNGDPLRWNPRDLSEPFTRRELRREPSNSKLWVFCLFFGMSLFFSLLLSGLMALFG